MKQAHPPLRSGYTTGACAAAAAKGATLLLRGQKAVEEISIGLPGGDTASFQLHGQTFTPEAASCFVIKDAGDDPDITNGAELHAEVSLLHDVLTEREEPIQISGGTGIGKVTKPGLAVPPGEWAINPVPRQMIEKAVREAFLPVPGPQSPVPINVIISIPDGEERAKKTLNARLGIIGGLSILGTTGIVRPISAKAWTDTIDAALDVARACGCRTVVLSTGRTSEMAAQKVFGDGDNTMILPVPGPTSPPPRLTEEAYIMMGDHVAYALKACLQRGFDRPIIACQFAKLLKIACGHPNTHAAASELDLATLHGWAIEASLSPALVEVISTANTARQIAVSSCYDPALISLVTAKAEKEASQHAPGIEARFLVCAYDGTITAPLA